MKTYRSQLKCLVGYSDHTPDLINPVAAIALGACVYEKHFTLDKNLPGPDHRMSLDPQELKATVIAIRQTETALGMSQKQVLPGEEENRLKLRKSLVSTIDIQVGTILQKEMIAIKRPGYGIAPCELENIINSKALVNIPRHSNITHDMLQR